jgi:hypothetical protein
MQGATKLTGAARAAALLNLTTCYLGVVRALLAAGETRLVAGMPTIFGLGVQNAATRVRVWAATLLIPTGVVYSSVLGSQPWHRQR